MFNFDRKNPRDKFAIVLLAVAVVVALVLGAYDFGYKRGAANPQIVTIQGITNIEQGKETGVDFSLFWDTWNSIKDKYVNAEKINNQDLVYGAISGLVEALKDPNSQFFSPSDAQKFNEDISGQFSGIGAEIGIKNDQLVIVAPLKGSPAEGVGLKAGDEILEIDGTSTMGLSVEEAVKLIRGEKGTVVKLSILREKWEAPKDFSVTRDIIQVPTLDWEMKGPSKDIAYIHLYNFYEQAPFLFYQAAIRIAANNAKGIILDLRNNPGGYLDVGVNLSGWFLNPGSVVTTEQFRSDSKTTKSPGPGLFKDTPVVILINQGSASASEILTGALHDDRGVKTVGNKSFGKGTVQELEPLKNDSLLKITIAHWLTPSGHLIDKNGITPDYNVDLTDDDVKAGRDPQLDKALSVIQTEIKNSKSIPIFTLPGNQ